MAAGASPAKRIIHFLFHRLPVPVGKWRGGGHEAVPEARAAVRSTGVIHIHRSDGLRCPTLCAVWVGPGFFFHIT